MRGESLTAPIFDGCVARRNRDDRSSGTEGRTYPAPYWLVACFGPLAPVLRALDATRLWEFLAPQFLIRLRSTRGERSDPLHP